MRQSRALAVTWSTRRSFLRCFEGEQQFGNKLTAVCWLHRGWQQAIVRSLAAQRKAATGQLGAIVQGAASAISSRALGP